MVFPSPHGVPSPFQGPSVREIAGELALRAEEFCRDWLPDGRRVGNYWQCADVDGGRGRSMAVHLRGPRAGKWTDYAEDSYGDLLDVIEIQLRTTKGQAVAEAERWLGLPNRTPKRSRKVDEPTSAVASSKAARRLFERGVPISDTPAEAYLRSRGITVFGPALRYCATTCYRSEPDVSIRWLPALLCAITDSAGLIVGVNRIYLTRGGTLADVPEPKKVLGRLRHCAVRFGAPGNVLVVGEGVETVLSIKTALPQLPIAAALTASNLSAFEPPERFRELWIARDADPPGQRAARRLVDRLKAERPPLRWKVLDPGDGDFNDRLKASGRSELASDLRAALGSSAWGFLG